MPYHIKLNALPSKNYLNSILRYEKETGFVYWKHSDLIVKSCVRCLSKYKRIMIDKIPYVLHRVIYQMHYGNLMPDEVIDHIDQDKQNNRIENLRKADVFLNNQNQGNRKNNTSGYKGVSWSKQKNKWRATITVNRKHKTLGFFHSKEDAYACYLSAKEMFHVAGQ
jgi:hypothetical protein